jgi:hypothetical protein
MTNKIIPKEYIIKILEKCGGRTKEEFEILVKYAVDNYNFNKDNNIFFNFLVGNKNKDIYINYNEYANEYNKCKDFIKYNVMLKKSKRVSSDVSGFKMADPKTAIELMGEEGYAEYLKKMETLKVNSPKVSVKVDTVEYECPIVIYMNLDTGIFTASFEIYKNFLFNSEKLYSFNKIASFLGYELNIIDRGSKVRKDIYMTFIKNYSEMEYININDMLFKPTNDIERKMIESKKLLTIESIKTQIEKDAQKIVEFSNIIEDCINQIIPKGADGRGILDK